MADGCVTCPHCLDQRWVCQAHPDRPFSGQVRGGCACGAPGRPCSHIVVPEPTGLYLVPAGA